MSEDTVEIPLELAKDCRAALYIAGEHFPQETLVRGENTTLMALHEQIDTELQQRGEDQ